MNKNIFLTGATSGIGEAAAIEFARQGHRLFLTARNPGKVQATEARLKAANPQVSVHWLQGDLASLADIRRIADEFIELDVPLDILFSNAGFIGLKQQVTHDGFEMMFGVNHLAPFALTNLLMDKLVEGENDTRVVVTASGAYKAVKRLNIDDLNWQKSFNPMKAYGQSKLANILFTQSLATKLVASAPNKRFSINCFHPGFVGTGLGTDTRMGKIVMAMCKPIARSGLKGAETGLFLANDESVMGSNGDYYYNCKKQRLSASATDSDIAESLWQASMDMAGLS